MTETRASLLLRIRNATDQTAWREFDQTYRPMLLNFCRAAGIERADAEDIVQGCMTSIAKHIRDFDYDPSRGRFKGWLRTLVNNRIRSFYRGRKPKQADTNQFMLAQDCEALPEAEFDKLWIREHLTVALELVKGEVAPKSFDAYRCLVLEGQPVEQVCELYDLNRNQLYAIKFRLTRKLGLKIRELLGEEFEI